MMRFVPAVLVLAPAVLAAGEFRFGDTTLTVPDGFTVEVAAAPPLAERPISIDFDDLGRLYVTDSSGSNDKVEKQLAEKPHRVVRLEDADGDGRFDRSTVFADKMMFPEGAMWYAGSLYVAAPPSIWKLTDTDGDGAADRREEWFQGKTLTGCANDLHGPYLGPDGWIYWAKGAFARQTHERPGRRPFVTRAAHIFRARPDGSGIEAVMTGGMDNPVDVVFTAEGERIFTTTFFMHPEAGRRDGLIHAVYGGVYGKVHEVIDEHPRTGDVLPVLVHMGAAAPCGLTAYASEAFGPGFKGSLFSAQFNLHKVGRHVLAPDGATFRSRDEDFLVSPNPDFHPTDVIEDADGSLLVVDTGGWYKLCCPTSQLKKPDILGAIYRVRREGAPRVPGRDRWDFDDPRGLKLAWDTMAAGEITRLFADPRPAVRSRALRVVAAKGDGAVPALAAVLAKDGAAEARRNAVWALTRSDGPAARAAARAGLDDRDDSVRHAAAHAASVHRDVGARPGLLALLKDGSPQLRRAAAEALGRIGAREDVPALLAAAPAAGGDRILEHSLTYALIEIADPEGTRSGLAAESPAARRAALIALDQMEGGGLKPEALIPFLSSPDAAVRDAASWIVPRRPEWGGALAGYFRERLAAGVQGEARAELERQLARLAKDGAIQDLLVAALRDGPREARLAALRAIAAAGLKDAPRAWREEVKKALADGDLEVVRRAVAAARSFPPPGKDREPAEAAELDAALLAAARDPSRPDDLRLEALAALRGGLQSVSPEVFDFLRAGIAPAKPVPVRAAAAEALSRARLGPAELAALAESLREVGPLEITRLLEAFKDSADGQLGMKLVASLKESAGLAGVQPGALRQHLAKFPAAVQEEAEKLLASIDLDFAAQKQRLEEVAASLPRGDVRRGQVVFNGAKAACATCHAIGYLGGRVGPDLTKIGEIRTERDLLESLLFPSASLVRSYEPVVVVRHSGEHHSGILKKDAADEVILSTNATEEVRIPREEIEDLAPGTVSIMPAGLEKLLTPQEIADLLAFLKDTRWGS
jgi:putative membrane-bound dehydrogenase-like protein